MRSAILIVTMFLSMNLAYANDEPQVEVDETPVQVDYTPVQGDDIAAYCDEQAQLADIVGTDEKREYMRDCVASFTTHLE